MLQKTDIGIGFRKAHFSSIFETWPEVDFFEIISENFMVDGGLPLYNLDRALERYRIVQHGVSLNLVSQDPLNWDYLRRLKALCRRTQTPYVTDHLCWTGSHGHHLHDLLPFPYTEELIRFTSDKARIVQDYLELPLGLENLSSYVSFTNSEMTEWDFYREVIERANIYYMCDINNIYVSSVNHLFNPMDYIKALDWQRVLQCHIAGHSQNPDGTILDTHDHPVRDEVWELYNSSWEHSGGFPTLLEWDDHFISFKETHAHALEALKVPARLGETKLSASPKSQPCHLQFSQSSSEAYEQQILPHPDLSLFQKNFVSIMATPFLFQDEAKQSFQYNKAEFDQSIVDLMVDRKDLKGIDRLCTYNQQYWFRLLSTMQGQYPLMVNQLGYFQFNRMISAYLSQYPSAYPSLDHLDDRLPQFMRENHEWNTELFHDLVNMDFIFSKNLTVAQREQFQSNRLSHQELTELADKPFPFQQGFSLFHSKWDVLDLRRRILQQKAVEDYLEAVPSEQYLAIYRSGTQFKWEVLSSTAHQLITLLLQSQPLSEALESLSLTLDEMEIEELAQEIQNWFSRWVQLGWFAHPN